jgi:shikimate kinase
MPVEKLFQHNIYILGFMGCGKSSVGKLLARRLDWSYLDTDACIVQVSGKSIPSIFQAQGEREFRRLESAVIDRVTKLERHVISLGGGSVLNPKNWALISASGVTICLDFPVRILAQRLAGDEDRPLLQGTKDRDRMQRLTGLLEQRNPIYHKADLVLRYDREETTPNIVNDVMDYLKGLS